MIKWVYCFLSVIILLGWPGESKASPSISGVSGSIVDSGSVSIAGSSFGSHNLNIEWLGGANGHIESGTDGVDFSKDGWTADSTSASRQAPVYSTARAHSHSKSVMSSWPVESQYDSTWIYDTGIDGVKKIYISWWVYFDHVDSKGQWKMWYIRHNSALTGYGGIVNGNQWYNEDGSFGSNYIFPFCVWSGSYAKCFPDSNDSLRYGAEGIPNDQWVRMEVYGEESSDIDVRDGTLIYKLHPQTDVVVDVLQPDLGSNTEWEGTIITRSKSQVIGTDSKNYTCKLSHTSTDDDKPITGANWSTYWEQTGDAGETWGTVNRYHDGTNRWRWWTFINYWGNIKVGDGTKEKVYIDDPYIQVGTQARIEIGDNVTWVNCTHREIQIPTAWSSSSITATVNQGSFKNGDSAYLFVVDGDGNASNGHPITIGGNAPPSPPSGLQVVD